MPTVEITATPRTKPNPTLGPSLKADLHPAFEAADVDGLVKLFASAAESQEVPTVSATGNKAQKDAFLAAFEKVVTEVRPEFRMGRCAYYPASGSFWRLAYFPNTNAEQRQRLQARSFGFTVGNVAASHD